MANITQWQCNGRSGARAAKILIWALAVMVMVGSTGCKKSASTNGPGKDSHGPGIKAVLHLEPFVVNLADPQDNRFLRVGIDLGLEEPLPGKEGKGAEGEVPTSAIRDCLLMVLSTWTSDALLAPDGKQKLKDELIHALHARVPELGVKEVYFTDFLVQR
jgi:flagellar FliL protein